jgi:hypothetical protein
MARLSSRFWSLPSQSTIGSVAGRCAVGLWRRLFVALRRLDPGDVQGHPQHDSQGASFGGGRKRGAEAHAIGRSRGGRTTKIHAIADSCGRPIAFEVTPGHSVTFASQRL